MTIGPIHENEPHTLALRDRVYHVELRLWGLVEGLRPAARHWPVLVKHGDGQYRSYGPDALLYIPYNRGPAYPCRVEGWRTP